MKKLSTPEKILIFGFPPLVAVLFWAFGLFQVHAQAPFSQIVGPVSSLPQAEPTWTGFKIPITNFVPIVEVTYQQGVAFTNRVHTNYSIGFMEIGIRPDGVLISRPAL